MKRGDIPGAYWAVLTHPATTNELVKKVFGEVHMLSHLVGAANRADIRRLRQLEDDNAALAATITRQQRQLRDGFMARDEAIRRLTDVLARRAGEMAPANDADARALSDALAEREKRLSEEVARRIALTRRLDKLTAELTEASRGRQSAERERDALVAELAVAESQIERLIPVEGEERDSLDLHQLCVLYVGGRSHQIPQLKDLVERLNGRFLHHDGGVEHNAALIPGLISRAHIAVFPVDCISHEAAAAVKRSCRLMQKRYLPLRTASLACLLAGLVQAAPSRPIGS
jgi:septal ring factor EnvC (AmiA/AmiB activator)